MNIGQTSGTRVLIRGANLKNSLASQERRRWTAEYFQSLDASDMTGYLDQLDRQASVQQNARWIHENADARSLQRDLRYAGRTRKWLYARAAQSRLDQDYEQWRIYAFLNQERDLTSLLNKNLDQLAGLTPREALA